MARPKKTLLARVLENTFRPGRYGELLVTETLPTRPPFRDERRRDLWQELLRVQRRYRERGERYDPYYFSQLVRALHGAKPPLAYRRGGVRFQESLDALLARQKP